MAAIEYACDEQTPEEECIKLIKPPFLFWNGATATLGPNRTDTPLERFRNALNYVGKKDLVTDEQLRELVKVMFYNHTVIELNGFVKKSELHDLIDEYFDEMSPMLNDTSMLQDWLYTTALKGNVSLKTDKALSAGRLTIELKKQGLNDKQIATYLREKGYSVSDEHQVRVLRNRAKKNHHDA
jgi:hypothetical protein